MTIVASCRHFSQSSTTRNDKCHVSPDSTQRQKQQLKNLFSPTIFLCG